MAISSGLRSWRNHAVGCPEATRVNGAISRPSSLRWVAKLRPWRAARADSNMAYRCAGSTRPAPISAAPTPGRASPTTESAALDDAAATGGCPVAPRAQDDRMASAPATSATSRRPAAISLAARLTSHCGVFPPMVVVSTRAGSTPKRADRSPAGDGPTGDRIPTTETRPMRGASPRAASRAARAARSARSIGPTGSSRSIAWPTAAITGTRAGSFMARAAPALLPAAGHDPQRQLHGGETEPERGHGPSVEGETDDQADDEPRHSEQSEEPPLPTPSSLASPRRLRTVGRYHAATLCPLQWRLPASPSWVDKADVRVDHL